MAAASTPRRLSWPPRTSRSRSPSGYWRPRVVAPGPCAVVRCRARPRARLPHRHRHRPAWICPGSTVGRWHHRRQTLLRQTLLLRRLPRRRPTRPRRSCWPRLASRRPRICRLHLLRTWRRPRLPQTRCHRRLPQTRCRPRRPQTPYRRRLPQTPYRRRLPQTPYRPRRLLTPCHRRLPQTPCHPRRPQTRYRRRLPQTRYRPRPPTRRRRLLVISTPLDHSRCRQSATRGSCGTRSRAKTSTGTTRWTRLHSRPVPTEDLRLGAYSDCWTLPQATNG